MRFRFVLVTFLFASSALAARFDDLFLDKTMRVDYFHTGNRGEEIIALDKVISDGPWPGSRTRLIDSLNLGEYFFDVIDRETNQPIYSRGFNSVFGEWATTDEAKTRAGTLEESVRFPWPRKPVQLVIRHRDKERAFQQVWSTLIDPQSRHVNSADRAPAGKVWTLFENGPVSEKVDLLIIGEGYTAAEQEKLHADVKRLAAKLFATEPFKSRQKDFNVRVLDLIEAQNGVNRPRTRDDRRTLTGVQYNIFDSERYVLTLQDHALRDVASAAPYDFLEILVNDKTYGGGGIFRDQATSCVDSAFAEYIFVHEFGHHFAGLADEYYTSPVAYETGTSADHPEPWEPNVTALHDPARLKWRELLEKGTPMPTPWEKEEFDRHAREVQKERARIRAANEPESVMDQLFREERAWDTKYLSSQKYAGKVGVFEGAAYESKGLYRPEIDCIMFTRDEVGFCRVCRRAIERIIDEYSRP
jgi:hypothetical protein